MKSVSILLCLVALCWATPAAMAQNSKQRNEILTELQKTEAGKGTVRVFEDEAVTGVLGKSMAAPRRVYSTGTGEVQYYRMRGFKIQAFSSNNQRTAKNEANQKQRLINTAFPDHETVVLFDSPFWRLRVGNFKTRQEANDVMREMRRKFPTFGKEMYVVVDEVKIPIMPEDLPEENNQ